MPSDTTLTALPATRPLAGAAALLRPGEWLLLAITLATGLGALLLSTASGQQVAWLRFLVSFVPGIGLLALGSYMRLRKGLVRTGTCAIASGIYIGFSGVVAILIYLRFPIGSGIYDAELMLIDTWAGYSWAGFTEALAGLGPVGPALGLVYQSSLAQLLAVICLLSWQGRELVLHRYMATGILSLLMAVAIWWAWPSLGPAAHVTLSPAIEEALDLTHGREAGAMLRALAREGAAVISPEIITGTIAFPSYHTVMACLVVWFLAGTALFWPALVVNAAMIPAILSHGGHHLSDVLGGIVVFFAALALAHALMRAPRPGA